MKAWKNAVAYLKTWSHTKEVPASMVFAYLAECLVLNLMNRRAA